MPEFAMGDRVVCLAGTTFLSTNPFVTGEVYTVNSPTSTHTNFIWVAANSEGRPDAWFKEFFVLEGSDAATCHAAKVRAERARERMGY